MKLRFKVVEECNPSPHGWQAWLVEFLPGTEADGYDGPGRFSVIGSAFLSTWDMETGWVEGQVYECDFNWAGPISNEEDAGLKTAGSERAGPRGVTYRGGQPHCWKDGHLVPVTIDEQGRMWELEAAT
jgi:hypothetical protein